MKITTVKLVQGALMLLISFALYSCSVSKQAKELVYLQDLSDSVNKSLVTSPETIFQPGDRLTITVSSLSPESVLPYNLNPSTGSATLGYLVENDGTIQIPQLGRVQVAGYTRERLKDSLTMVLKKYVMDPIITVQLVNFKITVLGDVSSPGTKVIPEGKMNLLEAIGLSGDLTFFGRRDNILVVREKDGKREYGRVDVRSANLFSSPYYHLKQNDLIYVELNKNKIASTDQTFNRNVSIATSLFSLLATAILLIVNLTR